MLYTYFFESPVYLMPSDDTFSLPRGYPPTAGCHSISSEPIYNKLKRLPRFGNIRNHHRTSGKTRRKKKRKKGGK